MPSQTIRDGAEWFGPFGTKKPAAPFAAECFVCGDPAVGAKASVDDGNVFTYFCNQHRPEGGFTSMIHSMWPKYRVTSRIHRGVYRVIRLSRKDQEDALRKIR